MKNKKTKIIIISVVAVIVLCAFVGLGKYVSENEEALNSALDTSEITTEDTTESTTESTTEDSGIRFGELLSVIENEDVVVVKAKITSSYSDKTTITQNYYNVADLIKNQGFEKYSELQYWAVTDMSDGSEQKVVSFTLDSETIQMIYNEKIVDNKIGDYADDLWVHTSLRDGLSDNN